jgi:hypothetical protein
MKELWIDPAGFDVIAESRIFIFDAGNVSVLEQYFEGVDSGVDEELWIRSVVKEHNPVTVYIDSRAPFRVDLSRAIGMQAQYEHWRDLWVRLRQHGYTVCQANNMLGVTKANALSDG